MSEDDNQSFTLWKMMQEMVQELFTNADPKYEQVYSFMKTILGTSDIANMFLCKDSNVNNTQRYHAFTVWLLGRLNHFVMTTKAEYNVQDAALECQVQILHQILLSQPHSFVLITKEYLSVLEQLVFMKCESYHENVINAFVPIVDQVLADKLDLTPIFVKIKSTVEYDHSLRKTLRMIEFCVINNVHVDKALTLCNQLLKWELALDISAMVYKLFTRWLKEHLKRQRNISVSLKKEIAISCNNFSESLCFVTDNKTKIEPNVFSIYQNCAVSLIELYERLDVDIQHIIANITRYLISNKDKVDAATIIKCLFIIAPDRKDMMIFSEHNLGYLNVIKKYVIEEIIANYRPENQVNSVETLSLTWKLVTEQLQAELVSEQCNLIVMNNYLINLFNTVAAIQCNFIREFKLTHSKLNFVSQNDFNSAYCRAILRFIENTKKKINAEVLSTTLQVLVLYTSTNPTTTYFQTVYKVVFETVLLSSGANKDSFLHKTKQLQLHDELVNVLTKLQGFPINPSAAVTILHSLCLYFRLGILKFPINLDEGLVAICNAVQSNWTSDIPIKCFQCLLAYYEPKSIKIADLLTKFAIRMLNSEDSESIAGVSIFLRDLVCLLSSTFKIYFDIPLKSLNRLELKCRYECMTCHSNANVAENLSENCIQDQHHEKVQSFSKARWTGDVVDVVLKLLKSSDQCVKAALIEALPCLAIHCPVFNDLKISKVWFEFVAGNSEELRSAMYHSLENLLLNIINNKDNKEGYVESLSNELYAFIKDKVKFSLETTDSKLQNSLLYSIECITPILWRDKPLDCAYLMLFFMVIPTSKHIYIAINVFIKIAKIKYPNPLSLYKKFKREICERLVKISVVCLSLNGQSMCTSLNYFSLVLGFFGSSHFIKQECRFLISFLVPLVIHDSSAVAKILNELTSICDQPVPQLLIQNYGYIYLQVILNVPSNEMSTVLRYLEKRTQLDCGAMQKQCFQVIINELLLNYHGKEDRVVKALKELLSDNGKKVLRSNADVANELQTHLPGILLYFDNHLLVRNTAKKKILLSFAALFRMMQPKQLSVIKFKIIATLRNIAHLNYGPYPNLVCDVWNSFIRCCDIEDLAPQLATIVVSLLSLITYNSHLVNQILRYLIITNEAFTSKYVDELFFVTDRADIDFDIVDLMHKHSKSNQPNDIHSKLRLIIRHLRHETVDIRLLALKSLKDLLRNSRAALHPLILHHNHTEFMIVDLLELLISGCRDKDESLRLACGECLGELGAIEPSQLPIMRQSVEGSASTAFAFYMDDEEFIFRSLNEFIRAIQAEKHTQNLDRFALSIQETLRYYDITPDPTSKMHELWQRFSESQQVLMTPWLSSRYRVVRTDREVPRGTIIFTSNVGASFILWAKTWADRLVSFMKSDHQTLFRVYLVSMRHDPRTLMHFLPHLVLHALLECDAQAETCIYDEFQAILDSVDCASQCRKADAKMTPMHGDDEFMEPHSLAKPIRDEGQIEHSSSQANTVNQKQCTKVIFVLLDFLKRWVREYEYKTRSERTEDIEKHYKRIKNFLKKFCHLKLARSNYYCGEYARALLHIEDFIDENSERKQSVLPALAHIFVQLDESDGVAGVATLSVGEQDIQQRLLALEITGKIADAAACYERLPRPLSVRDTRHLIRCYLSLDNVNTALAVARDLISEDCTDGRLLEMQAESFWRLSQWDELDSLLQRPALKHSDEFQINIGRALLHFQREERDQFQHVIDTMKRLEVTALSSVSLEYSVYQHEYDRVAQLHAISELEDMERCTHAIIASPDSAEKLITKLTTDWQLRLELLQETVRIREPVLCLRRAAVSQAYCVLKRLADKGTGIRKSAMSLLDQLQGSLWIASAKAARRANMLQQCFSYLVKAEPYNPSALFIQTAKLHWEREEHQQALATLAYGVQKLTSSGANKLPETERRHLCARAQLLTAKYNDRISNVDTESNIKLYKMAVEWWQDWEKGLLAIAQFYDKVVESFSEDVRDANTTDMQICMITYYGKSLMYGCKYVHQSMPRMLSIWFDYGSRLLNATNSSNSSGLSLTERRSNLLRMTKAIDTLLDRLPTFIFLTAFSQLVSRICHPQKEVYIQLKLIIVRLISHYPQQTLWMLTPAIQSSYQLRSKRCAEILGDHRLRGASMVKLLKDFTQLTSKLVELCTKTMPSHSNSNKVEVVDVNTLSRALPRLLTREDMSAIMMPTFHARKMQLPPNGVYQQTTNADNTPDSNHNPFPPHVHITGIESKITILSSMQRPRKIMLRGSDGKLYTHMLKANDDLRRDFRLMEFNDIVNGLLQREPDARQRGLAIRLYSVAPLNESCGLIEWVDGLVGLRPILLTLYQQFDLGIKPGKLKEIICDKDDPFAKKRRVFMDLLIPKHPPVLPFWFRHTFPDVQTWLNARNTYTRTVAVMSMVGYVLGLGDRHGENILLDSRSGDAVHVDFNCLFNKGESFAWPERVPFRLTHNMVAAMGPLGVKGFFRTACVSTLSVLRKDICTLMSVVTPFVYDPMVEPQHKSATAGQSKDGVAERTNALAVEHVHNIELRLKGQVRVLNPRGRPDTGQHSSIALSVEGQVDRLIAEATSIDNLCQMYLGWGPYL